MKIIELSLICMIVALFIALFVFTIINLAPEIEMFADWIYPILRDLLCHRDYCK
jgi:hypothetical protein